MPTLQNEDVHPPTGEAELPDMGRGAEEKLDMSAEARYVRDRLEAIEEFSKPEDRERRMRNAIVWWARMSMHTKCYQSTTFGTLNPRRVMRLFAEALESK